jgi:glycosyltransferase involved in cell wall biosynthesis
MHSAGPDAPSAKMPRGVCLLATEIDAATGGVQIQSRRLVAGLGELGISTFIITRNYVGAARRERQGSTVILRSPVVRRSTAAINSLLYLVFGVFWLIRFRKQYDVIQCQQMFGSAMAGLLARSILRKPVVVRVTSTGTLGEVAYLRAMPGARTRLRQLRGVDRWVALTGLMRDEIASLGVPRERIVIIPNSAAMPASPAYEGSVRADARQRLALGAGPIAVFTGRLSSEKGLDTLLDAWKSVVARHPDARLIVLGAGGAFRNVEPALRAQRAALALETSVELRGHVDNVGEFLLASNLFVLPTRTEGMSNSLVEAMAAGTAVVTTDIPAHVGVVAHDVDALLVPPDQPDSLADAISSLFSDPQRAERIGRAARAKAEEQLGVTQMIRRYLAVYTDLTGRK